MTSDPAAVNRAVRALEGKHVDMYHSLGTRRRVRARVAGRRLPRHFARPDEKDLLQRNIKKWRRRKK